MRIEWQSHLAISIGLIGVVLVVPVLEVLVDGSLLGRSGLATHSSETTTSLGRLSVQSLVEGGIARDILALKGSRSHGVEWVEERGVVLKGVGSQMRESNTGPKKGTGGN